MITHLTALSGKLIDVQNVTSLGAGSPKSFDPRDYSDIVASLVDKGIQLRVHFSNTRWALIDTEIPEDSKDYIDPDTVEELH